jgi:hypothetical protein
MAQKSVVPDNSRRDRGRALIVGGLALVGVGSSCTTAFFDPVFENSGAGFRAGCMVAVILSGVVMVPFGVHDLRKRRRLGTPTLMVPGGLRLPLGSVVPARFHRPGGRPLTWSSVTIKAALVCEEQATYSDGSISRTATSVVLRRELAVTRDQTSTQAAGVLTIEIPLTGPPSLNLTLNRIVWWLEVYVRGPGVPEDTSRYAMTILPAVAAEAPP